MCSYEQTAAVYSRNRSFLGDESRKRLPDAKVEPRVGIDQEQIQRINFIDTYHRSGLYKRDLPFIGGQEGGFVAASLPEAEQQGVKVGDRVAYSSVFQTYAEYTAVPAHKVVTVPEEIPLDVAVSCGVQV